MYKDKEVNKNVKNIFLSMCDVRVFLTFTSLNLVLLWLTILPILFQYCYKYCYSDNRNLWAVMKAGGLALLKTDSTHHFFRNACTKSGSLRFSQFSGCWLILSVYILMSFGFPFVRLFGVRVIVSLPLFTWAWKVFLHTCERER